jgi:hypothetical protein
VTSHMIMPAVASARYIFIGFLLLYLALISLFLFVPKLGGKLDFLLVLDTLSSDHCLTAH